MLFISLKLIFFGRANNAINVIPSLCILSIGKLNIRDPIANVKIPKGHKRIPVPTLDDKRINPNMIKSIPAAIIPAACVLERYTIMS